MEELFKKLVDLAGYGLVGLAIACVLVLGYLAIKRPNNKFGIIIVSGFSLLIISLFTFAGVGVAKENKEVKSENQNLNEDKKKLTNETKVLDNKVKVQEAKLDIVKFQNLVVNSNDLLPKDSITQLADDLTKKFEILSFTDTGVNKAEWSGLANDYKSISTRLKTYQFTTSRAVSEFKNSNMKIYNKVIHE